MIDKRDLDNIAEKGIAFTIRSAFVIDPAKQIRLRMMYPASTGRNPAEVLRVIDWLQMGDKRALFRLLIGRLVMMKLFPLLSRWRMRGRSSGIREI